MGKNLISIITAAVLAVLATGFAIGPAVSADITLVNPYLEATVPGAPVAGGYLEIHNSSASADKLIGIEVGFAAKSQIHSMTMVEGVMRMRPVTDGVHIASGDFAVFKPGGLHLMFMGLTKPLVDGESHQVTLIFAKEGRRDALFEVVAPNRQQPHSMTAE